MNTHLNSIVSIREKFPLVLGMALFFPVVLEALFNLSPDKAASNYQTLTWGVVIAVFIIDYLILEHTKEKILKWASRWIEISVLLNMAFYVPVLFVLSLFKETLIPAPYAVAFGVGLLGILYTPVVILVLLFLSWFQQWLVEFKKDSIGIWNFISSKFIK